MATLSRLELIDSGSEGSNGGLSCCGFWSIVPKCLRNKTQNNDTSGETQEAEATPTTTAATDGTRDQLMTVLQHHYTFVKCRFHNAQVGNDNELKVTEDHIESTDVVKQVETELTHQDKLIGELRDKNLLLETEKQNEKCRRLEMVAGIDHCRQIVQGIDPGSQDDVDRKLIQLADQLGSLTEELSNRRAVEWLVPNMRKIMPRRVFAEFGDLSFHGQLAVRRLVSELGQVYSWRVFAERLGLNDDKVRVDPNNDEWYHDNLLNKHACTRVVAEWLALFPGQETNFLVDKLLGAIEVAEEEKLQELRRLSGFRRSQRGSKTKSQQLNSTLTVNSDSQQ